VGSRDAAQPRGTEAGDTQDSGKIRLVFSRGTTAKVGGGGLSRDGGDTKPNIGLGVWAESVEHRGQYFSLEKHTWSPKEPFYLWMEAYAPVNVTILQVYPKTDGPPKTVVPKDRDEAGSNTILPSDGPKRLPFEFVMDPDSEDEYMRIIAVRADDGLTSDDQQTQRELDQINRMSNNSSDYDQLVSRVAKKAANALKIKASELANSKGATGRFDAKRSDSDRERSQRPDDVAAVLYHSEGKFLATLKLQK
jgi:hypothetical protein